MLQACYTGNYWFLVIPGLPDCLNAMFNLIDITFWHGNCCGTCWSLCSERRRKTHTNKMFFCSKNLIFFVFHHQSSCPTVLLCNLADIWTQFQYFRDVFELKVMKHWLRYRFCGFLYVVVLPMFSIWFFMDAEKRKGRKVNCLFNDLLLDSVL